MNVAVRTDISSALTPPRRAAGVNCARIDVYDDLAAAEPAWRRLEAMGALATPYQRFEWIALWHEHVSRAQGMTPMIVVATDAFDVPMFLLPLARRRKGPLSIAGFFGGRHSNLNAGLWRRDVAANITADELGTILCKIATDQGIDLLKLAGQPREIAGADNPLALLPHQRTPDDVYAVTFHGHTGEQALRTCLNRGMRGRLRAKERKLAEFPGYRYARATEPADVDRYLDAFFRQKSAHLTAQGLPNVFDDDQVVAFLRAACHEGLREGRPVIELHVLECDEDVIAIFGGVSDGRRLSCMVNSYTTGEARRWSPGLVLLTHLVTYCGDHGITQFDLGAGYAEYKTVFCKRTEKNFDTIMGCSLAGRVSAVALTASRGFKRWLKSTPALWNATRELRRYFS